MSVRKLTASLLTALAMLSGAAMASAQQYAPFADPFAFDPDFRWFEPVYDMDLAEMKAKKRAPTGWFATYDRLSLNGSRPEVDEPGSSEYLLDNGWGHRYEIGFMLPGEDNGWMFNWTTNDVGRSFTVRQERLNRFIDPDDGFDPVAPPFGVAVRQEEDNNVGYNFRFYDVSDSENIVDYDSYELNKVWRLEPYHYGGILEPMIGFRWMRVVDDNLFDTYTNTLDNPPLAGPNFTDAEQYTRALARTRNEMFGGQLGARYTKYQNRFIFSGNLRCFFGGSWQNSEASVFNELTIYDGNGQGSNVTSIFTDRTEPINTRNEEFFYGFDVRGEVGYQLTKMVSVRGGFQLINIARGVWRGGDGTVVEAGDNDQDYLMVGATFGLNLNH
ncbi:MAG: BBP7 family outer membrane beta-barrel protein [Planctomycetota bacterium]